MIDLLSAGLAEYGIRELPRKEHNKRILEYFADIGHEWVKDDETAWCSAFINYIAKNTGYPYTGKLNARSWLKLGKSVIDAPKIGDLVIFWRESPQSWKGHVGLFIRSGKSNIFVLGGNQSNAVNIKPYRKDRLLDIRRLNKIK